MTQAAHVPGSRTGEVNDRVPVIQQLLDYPFLLLLAGLAIPSALFLAWRAAAGLLVS